MLPPAKPHVWIIQSGEPLAIKGNVVRPMRSALIADALLDLGATVTRWASTFDHRGKTYMAEPGYAETTKPGLDYRLLHGRPYKKNVSLQRILNQREVAADLLLRHHDAPRPDLIYTSLPTIDLADAAVTLAERWKVPCFIDFRDMWPEIFLDVSPLPRRVTKILIQPLYAQARSAMSRATGIISITSAFLDKALQLAGRSKREADGVFVHAYQRTPYTSQQVKEAEDFWRGQGLALDGTEDILCYVGGLTESVAFEPLLAGLEALDQNLKQNTRIVMCGTGSMQTMLAASKTPNLKLPGFVDGARIATLLSHAVAGLLPYPNRPDFLLSYPNKVGEYLSVGLPILSSLGGETGALLTSRDAGIICKGSSGWADAIHCVLSNRARRNEMKANAMLLYEDMFDADVVYRELAKRMLRAARSN